MRSLTIEEARWVSGAAAGDSKEIRNASECIIATVTTGAALTAGQFWLAALSYLVALSICSDGAKENMETRISSGEMNGVDPTVDSVTEFIWDSMEAATDPGPQYDEDVT